MSNVKNYKEQGGDRWVVGGRLEVVEGGKLVLAEGAQSEVSEGGVLTITNGSQLEILEDGALVVQGSELEPVTGQVDSSAATTEELKKDFNDLLAVLYAAGLIVADKTDLLEEIASARVLLDEAEVGEEEGQYPEAAYTAFEAAILAAEGVADKQKPRQSEMDTAKTTLLAAVSTFEATVITE